MIYYHSCPNLYIFPLLNTKEDILKNVGTQMILVPIDFNCIFLLH